ncbi:Beta-hexosaminidase [termite gut metagenome]|uniref:beta-N-acetylhexosaminidase n=1 Tax=termite gut metagenome TaxID=433724 RepID=A0A5J4T0H2_9ZZZZ
MKKIFLFSFMLFIAFSSYGKPECDIIPVPQSIKYGLGYFEINSDTKIACPDIGLKPEAKKLQAYITAVSGKEPEIVESTITDHNVIVLERTISMNDESYQLNIGKQRIICRASTEVGIFYAGQSLIQITDSLGNVPCMDINDEPRFQWRGLMLDESRHFFGKEVVMQQLDIMARLKLNRYHWHLTDENGWRIEIKKYPKLTQEGAFGNWNDRNAPPAYYSQEDIREIVQYANERHIMIIPEIDMPGHATAVSRAYPSFTTGGKGRWAGFTLYPVSEETYEFVYNVLKEVAALFPAPYIHLGGDEVDFGSKEWLTDPEIQKFIQSNQLIDIKGLEHYFLRRACGMINSLGKMAIGWDEVISSGLTPDQTVVMWWRHDKETQLEKALNDGFRVILCPRIPCYFDFVQDESHKIGRRWGKSFNAVEQVYGFPDNLPNLVSGNKRLIAGIQANIWTERIADKKRLDFMTFPRLIAIAEGAWSDPGCKNFDNFQRRLKLFFNYLNSSGIYYFNPFDTPSTPEPWGPDHADIISEG